MLCGGTVATVFLQVVASIRQGTVCPLIVVLPVVTFAGMNDGWPGARISSAAREQFPLAIVHQFCVIG
jgi:hypothetical protein